MNTRLLATGFPLVNRDQRGSRPGLAVRRSPGAAGCSVSAVFRINGSVTTVRRRRVGTVRRDGSLGAHLGRVWRPPLRVVSRSRV